jgi:hypothetical protein
MPRSSFGRFLSVQFKRNHVGTGALARPSRAPARHVMKPAESRNLLFSKAGKGTISSRAENIPALRSFRAKKIIRLRMIFESRNLLFSSSEDEPCGWVGWVGARIQIGNPVRPTPGETATAGSDGRSSFPLRLVHRKCAATAAT